MQLFSFGTDFLAYTREKYFSSNLRFFIYFQLEGCLARTDMRKMGFGGWDEFSTTPPCVSSISLPLVGITQPFGQERHHTTIRTERGA